MGVINVTPDSFSDGGQFFDADSAADHATRMISEGADIIDVGGESTRPATFSDNSPLDPQEEIRRVVPVLERIRARHPEISLSVDTYKMVVAKAALAAGAEIVNDISGLTYDPAMAGVVARNGCKIVIMHLPGRPRSILNEPQYLDVVREIAGFWKAQIKAARAAGIDETNIILDPGIGFGKNAFQNLEILRRLRELTGMGYPVLVGASRKRFIGHVLGIEDPKDRVEGTAAAVALSVAGGAEIVRVHDVKQMVRVVKVSDAIIRGWDPNDD